MSMMNDITCTVTSFCKRNELSREQASQLLESITIDLEWGLDDNDDGDNIEYWISREWED